MATFNSLVPAASLNMQAYQNLGQSIVGAGRAYGQARNRASLLDLQREQLAMKKQALEKQLDAEESNQRMDRAFKVYQVQSKIDPVGATRNFFSTISEDTGVNLFDKININIDDYEDFSKNLGAISKMYTDAKSRGLQNKEDTKEKIAIGIKTLIQKYPRRREEIFKSLQETDKALETIFQTKKEVFKAPITSSVYTKTPSGEVQRVFEGEKKELPETPIEMLNASIRLGDSFRRNPVIKSTLVAASQFSRLEDMKRLEVEELKKPTDKQNFLAIDNVYITLLRRMADTESSVREEEFRRVPEGQKLLNRLLGLVQKVAVGGERLTKDDREAIFSGAGAIMSGSSRQYNDRAKLFRGQAMNAGLDPQFVAPFLGKSGSIAQNETEAYFGESEQPNTREGIRMLFQQGKITREEAKSRLKELEKTNAR